MTSEDLAAILTAIFAAATAGLVFYALRRLDKETRGTFGRDYGNVIAEMTRESARRSRLLTQLAAAREGRFARLERRAEGGR
ncbi:MAG: hypothetical protein MUC37_08680 [Hyphomicrobium sp.]|jgi:hypothetical protein|nr:hypothetical protein [Hyphomicrobium sp.]